MQRMIKRVRIRRTDRPLEEL